MIGKHGLESRASQLQSRGRREGNRESEKEEKGSEKKKNKLYRGSGKSKMLLYFNSNVYNWIKVAMDKYVLFEVK